MSETDPQSGQPEQQPNVAPQVPPQADASADPTSTVAGGDPGYAAGTTAYIPNPDATGVIPAQSWAQQPGGYPSGAQPAAAAYPPSGGIPAAPGFGPYPPAPPTGIYPPGGLQPPPPGAPGGPQFGYPPQPAEPGYLARLPLPSKLALGAAVAGIITFFMGFVSWVSIDSSIERDFDNWASDNLDGDSIGLPAFTLPTTLFSPGVFLILLGVAGVSAVATVAPRWRKYLPHIAALTVLGYLGLFSAALGLPGFISFGAGAYVALVFGFAQLALIAAAAIIEGHRDESQ